MAGTYPETGTYRESATNEGVVHTYGSFQGTTGAVLATQVRGNGFTVTRVSAGRYRVTLAYTLPTAHVQGQPAGLLEEPRAWVVSETVGTQPVKGFIVQTSRYDGTTNVGSFDIWTLDSAAANAVADVTTADRVCFVLGWKSISTGP